MLRNIGVIAVCVVWGALAVSWLVYYIWTRVDGADFAISTIAVRPMGIYLVLNTAKLTWFLIFLAASIGQTIAARYLFSD